VSDCDRFRGRIEELHDGELPEEIRGEVERHAGSCADCGAELERVRRLERLLVKAETPFRGDVNAQVVRIRERIAERGPRVLKMWILGAAAAGLAAFGVVWLATRPSEPTEDKVARLVREYLAARNGQSERLATEISSMGGQAVPVVCRMINEAPPAEQVKLSKVIARFGEGERKLILQYLGGPGGGDEIVLTASGWDEESDREIALRLARMLVEETAQQTDPKLKRMAEQAVERVVRWGNDREADAEIRRAVLAWMHSDNPELVRKAAELADSAQLAFTDAEVVGLLAAPSSNVRQGARKYLVAKFGEDLGPDPAAWEARIRK